MSQIKDKDIPTITHCQEERWDNCEQPNEDDRGCPFLADEDEDEDEDDLEDPDLEDNGDIE